MRIYSMEYPVSSVEKMLKRSGLRVSKDAVMEFAQLLEEITADIASESDANAKRNGRKTVSIEDVVAAERKIV